MKPSCSAVTETGSTVTPGPDPPDGRCVPYAAVGLTRVWGGGRGGREGWMEEGLPAAPLSAPPRDRTALAYGAGTLQALSVGLYRFYGHH